MDRLRIALLVCLLLFLGACGYSVHRAPMDSVRLGKIENRTFEPKLEDRLNEALTGALLRNGIHIDPRAAHTVKGTVEEFHLRSLAEKERITVTYEVIIKGRFYLVDLEGRQRELRSSGVFIVTFGSEEVLERVLALKEEATLRALDDLSEELTASLLYGQ